MKNLIKDIILIIIGGLIYTTIEILSRGYSHWTMFLLGGICFLLIGKLNEHISWDMFIWKQQLCGMCIITALEFITGLIVNLYLKWNIWDYSNTPFNILGQICLPFMFIWFLLSLVAILLDDWLRYWLFEEEKPRYRWK